MSPDTINFPYISQILAMTLFVTLTSTTISVLVGFPLGYLLSKSKKYLKPLRSLT